MMPHTTNGGFRLQVAGTPILKEEEALSMTIPESRRTEERYTGKLA